MTGDGDGKGGGGEGEGPPKVTTLKGAVGRPFILSEGVPHKLVTHGSSCGSMWTWRRCSGITWRLSGHRLLNRRAARSTPLGEISDLLSWVQCLGLTSLL